MQREMRPANRLSRHNVRLTPQDAVRELREELDAYYAAMKRLPRRRLRASERAMTQALYWRRQEALRLAIAALEHYTSTNKVVDDMRVAPDGEKPQ